MIKSLATSVALPSLAYALELIDHRAYVLKAKDEQSLLQTQRQEGWM